MDTITWDSSYAVGVDFMDREHRRLFDLVDGLKDAMRSGRGADALGSTLAGLIGYTRSHFGHEEAEMARLGYPDRDAHVRAHAALIEQVADFQSRHAAGELALSVDLASFLNRWLVTHIATVDRTFANWLLTR